VSESSVALIVHDDIGHGELTVAIVQDDRDRVACSFRMLALKTSCTVRKVLLRVFGLMIL
jgi:hypothetical protein